MKLKAKKTSIKRSRKKIKILKNKNQNEKQNIWKIVMKELHWKNIISKE